MARLLERSGVEADSRFVRINGRRLHYLEAGAGPAIALVHGAGGGAANWYRLLAPLAARFRVLALDLPGFGLSETMPLRAPLGVNVAETVREWLDAAGVERCVLAGTSLGGLLALRVAQHAPSAVRRLVLLDSAGLGRELPFILRVGALPGVGRLFLRDPKRSAIAWWFRHYLTSDRSRLAAPEETALIDYLWKSDLARDAEWMEHATRLFASVRGQREVLSDRELAGLKMPTLVAWGERDRLFPTAHARRAAAVVPRTRLALLPTVGHSANWENPDALLERMLPFLTRGEQNA